jgi:Zn-dependent protease/predicted transcriptional regulator
MFGKRIDLFRVQGIAIGFDPSWVIIVLLVTWSLAMGFFPVAAPGHTRGTYWLMGAVGALGLFASIIVHELAHALVAKRIGINIRGITLFVFGGVAEMQGEPPSPRAEFLMAGAGPLTTMIIALVCFATLAVGGVRMSTEVRAVMSYLATINVVIGIFNLVPAFPLDGGRILRAALWHRSGDIRRATRTAARFGMGFGIALILIGLWSIFTGNFIGGLWLAVIGMFVRGAAMMSYQQVLVRETLKGEPVRRFMKADPIKVPPDATITELVDDYVYKYHHKLFPVAEDGRLIGCVSTKELKAIPRQEWETKPVASIVTRCSLDNTVTPETDAAEALTKMRRTGESRLLVVDGDRLAGMLTLKDLLEFFALKLEVEG